MIFNVANNHVGNFVASYNTFEKQIFYFDPNMRIVCKEIQLHYKPTLTVYEYEYKLLYN